ncbi:MAG TPA: lamin tail domain-containing protein [Verrucomicrobiales bacterium]|nr:lamin tail domain-containing protein [Verrucomicrobiales bacterium]
MKKLLHPLLLAACTAVPVRAQVIISEFMASNSRTVADENGSFEDWIELYNPSAAAASMDGWALTDDATDLAKWSFPAGVSVPARGYLLVWASNKDRRNPGSPLHTNFKLNGDGDYLALVKPDSSKATEFAPEFPVQRPDISYGPAAQTTGTVALQQGAAGKVLVPTDGSLATSWTAPEFSDAAWTNATNGIGFESGANEYGTIVPGNLQDGPAGYFRLEEAGAAGTVAVNQGTAGAAANGTYTGSPILGVDGPRPPSEAGMPADNRAMRANAAGYVQTPYSAALNPPVFTVECWAKATGGAGTFRAAVSNRNDDGAQTYGYIFYAASNNTWQFWTGSGGSGAWDPITGPAVTLNTWVHLVGTYDGAVKRFFVNGTQAGTGASATFNINTARGMRIGAGQNEAAANFLFAGDVDEVAVYSRVLTPAEISQRYQYAKNNTPPAAVNDFNGLISTNLQTQMLNNNASAYFRLPFNVADASAIGGLTLKMKYDDGFQAWLNGVPVAGGNVPQSLTWNAAATDRSTNAEAVVFESFNLNSALNALRTGNNVLAIQGLNLSASNPDFLQLAQLELTNAGAYSTTPVYLAAPTPGGINGTGSSTPGPSISLATVSPAAPTAADDLKITCRVQPVFFPVSTVTLNWRASYAAVQQLAMNDSGTNGDAVAGDEVYTAVIPKASYAAGNMVRWYFTAVDAGTNSSRWPVFKPGDKSPEYLGTVIAATGFTTALPVWYWFAQNTGAAATRGGTFGSVFYQGEFYDNVFVRLRGGATSTGSKKFDFNSGFHCRIDDTVGRVEEANLNGTSLSSGIGGDSADATLIRPALAYEVYRTSGHYGSHSFPVMMRVNGALDSGSGRGGIAYFVEQVDERYLRRNNLDEEGSLYKMDQRSNLNPVFFDSTNGVQKRTRLTETNADLQEVVNGIHSPADGYNYPSSGPAPAAPNPPAGFLAARKTYMFDNLDLANMVNYLSCRAIIGDSDDTRKNFYMYRDTNDTREWRLLPWDKDGTFGISLDDTYYSHPFKGDFARRKSPGANANNQWSYLWEALYNEPATRDMYLRRLRTLMDTILQPAPGGYLQGRADFWWAAVAPHKAGASPAAIKTWLNTRRNELFNTYSAANSLGTGIQIPPAQNPAITVNFGNLDYNPASGNQNEEYVEIVNPNTVAVDISGWELKRGIEHKFTAGTVILPSGKMIVAGKSAAFRSRTASPHGGENLFVQGNYNGTISARGETIELWDPKDPAITTDDRLVAILTTPANPTPAQQSLRITEVMYDPAPGGAFAAGEYEYLELKNIGAGPLTLTGATFTDGIDFTFAAATLNPGARLLLVKNQTAFESRYGAGLPVGGVYTGALDNSGERLRIVDASGEEVLDFRYEGTWYPSTHGDTVPGGGQSLVIEDATAAWDTWASQSSWRGSTVPSPGIEDAPPAVPVLTSVTGSTLHLTGVAGRSYLLQRSSDLNAWTDAAYAVAAPNNTIAATDPSPPPNRSFYRVRAK